MARRRLSIPRLEAIVGALDFVLAGEFDPASHDQPAAVYADARDWASDELCRREQRRSDRQAQRAASRAGFA